MTRQRQVLLVRRPQGAARLEDFALVEGELPALAEGEALVRNRFLSIDPYQRGRMGEGQSYVAPHPLGQVMLGSTAGEVVASRSERWPVGARVVGPGGWQEHAVIGTAQAAAWRLVDDPDLPLSLHLGSLGLPGITAWYAFHRVCRARAGETVLASAATGAVGSAFAALGRAHGCRMVGIAGGPDKCRHATEALGYAACVDHRAAPDAESLRAALQHHAPEGFDAHLENVGGRLLDAALASMKPGGRIAVCGMVASYEGGAQPLAQPQLILMRRLTLQGFAIGEHPEVRAEALAELRALVRSGRLRANETIAEGLDAAPAALLGLLQGRNLGKQLVRLT